MELTNRKRKNYMSDIHKKKAMKSMQRNLMKNRASVKNILDSNLQCSKRYQSELNYYDKMEQLKANLIIETNPKL